MSERAVTGVLDEGVVRGGLYLDFVGSGVTVTSSGNKQTISIPGGVGSSPITTKLLSADQSNSTTTLTKVTGLDLLAGVGTFAFTYYILYLSASSTATGVRFSVNHSGTVGFFLANMRWVDTSATASTAAPKQNNVQAAGAVMGSFSARAKSTTGWGTTISVDTLNAYMLMIIEGLMEVTTSGNIELWHGSEVAASTTVKAKSALILTSIT